MITKIINKYLLTGIILILATTCAKTNIAGPIFLQVHFTNRLYSISDKQMKSILGGEINSFKFSGESHSPLKLYVDSNIFEQFKKKFPNCNVKKAEFNENFDLASDKNFIGFSGIKGLMPHFKTLYINNILPWGQINKKYILKKNTPYPWKIEGAEEWNNSKEISVVQTGVTALTRGLVRRVDRIGNIYYPIKFTEKITSNADIAVTSNEVSFLDPCGYPKRGTLRFCSPKKYFKILTKSGFDLIELSGNHNNDYGCGYNTDTINMLKKNKIDYFGGGLNRFDAYRVKYKKVKKSTFAFTAFNEWGPVYAWAKKNKPGAAKLSKKLFLNNIKKAVKKSNFILVSVQWGNENDPKAWKKQINYFHLAADNGATIMLSSSAHRAMGIEFYKGKFISYGLGNFLFDQMQTINHRRGLIARHHFYKGRHIETELIPYLIYNYSQARTLPYQTKEAKELMKYIFKYSRGYVFK